jgi:hypothetical protein
MRIGFSVASWRENAFLLSKATSVEECYWGFSDFLVTSREYSDFFGESHFL